MYPWVATKAKRHFMLFSAMTVSVLCFFFQKTKQKNINLPADIDIFIYLIKIDCVGVKRVATGVL